MFFVAVPYLQQAPPLKVPQAEVPVAGRFLKIPGLPGSTTQAFADGAQARKSLQECLLFVAEALAEERKLSWKGAPPEDQARPLIKLLKDEAYRRLEQDVLQEYTAWKTVLTEVKVGAPASPKPDKPSPEDASRAKAAEAARQRMRLLEAEKDLAHIDASLDKTPSTAVSMGASADPDSLARQWRNLNNLAAERSLSKAAAAKVLTDAFVTRLPEVWKPLITDLEGFALQVAKLEEKPTTDPGLLQLRHLVRLKLMARLRTTLVFCGQVWHEVGESGRELNNSAAWK